jgi:group I intron endonuclease
MVSIGIYKIISPSHRIYVGQSINIEQRWKGYFPSQLRSQPKIKNSILKYGIENHIFEIIEECNIENLTKREIYWKQYYLDQVNGDWGKVLFCELYDNGGGPRSKFTKYKISNSKKGISRSQEVKDNISLGKTGVKFSNEHKENITKSKRGCKYPNFKTRKDKGISKNHHIEAVIKSKIKPIIQLDLEGNFIKEWKSGKEASRVLNINQANINIICNGKGKTYKGFIWKFKI